MAINKIQDKLNELLDALTEAGYDNEIDIKLPVACHIDFHNEFSAKARVSMSSLGSSPEPTAPIKFRYGAGNVNLLGHASERRPILMAGDSTGSDVKAMKKPMKKPEPKTEPKIEPNMDALLFEADMKRL